MPKHKRYCPDCGSLMDIRGTCECHHPRAICPLFRGLAKTMGNHFILCARQDGAVIQAREFASMPERNEFYRWKCCANPLDCHGDEIRVAFGEDVGYTNDERLRWAGRIFRVCRLLSDQGIDVVCCSIAMFDTVRRWNREHIPNYKEIYIRVKKETLIQRNQKVFIVNILPLHQG